MTPKQAIRMTALVCAALVSGCAESTRIRTSPPGAKVYVDGAFVGVSPTVYSVPRSQFSRPHICRVELAGYAPAEEKLRTTLAPGRIVGGVFTLGILFAFKGPTSFRDPADFALEKLPEAPATAAPVQGVPAGPSVEQRLQRLRTLRAQGAISQEEYERHELELLRGQ